MPVSNVDPGLLAKDIQREQQLDVKFGLFANVEDVQLVFASARVYTTIIS